MDAVKRAATSIVQYPGKEYRRFKDYRHRRIRDEKIAWNLQLWERLHPSLQQGFQICTGLVAGVLVLCLVFSIWAGVNHHVGPGLVLTLHQGECSAARTANFWIHLFINAIASSIYAVSSYAMQRLAAPTRIDIDRAHQAGADLKVGSLALTNFALLSKARLIVFGILWCSSLPLHLVFNSLVIYSSTNAEWSSYSILVSEEQYESLKANTSILSAAPARNYLGTEGFSYTASLDATTEVAELLIHQQPPLVELSPHECIQEYSKGTSTIFGDAFLISEQNKGVDEAPLVIRSPPYKSSWPTPYEDPWSWMCQGYWDKCDRTSLLQTARWTIDDNIIQKCLARRFEPQCELNLSMSIMIIVLICISSKLVSMILAVVLSRNQPLITIGDAIDSFLRRPDPTARTRCAGACSRHRPVEVDGTRKLTSNRGSRKQFIINEMPGAWWWAMVLGYTCLGLAFYFFGFSYRETRSAYSGSSDHFNFTTMADLGFGTVPAFSSKSLSTRIMVYDAADNPSTSYISGAILANLPQLALSALYLLFNNLFTRICMAFEFRSFARRRRGLRVTMPSASPSSVQRRAHFLQIPLRWSLLNMVIFVLLHTFLSQTLFLQRIYAIFPKSFDDPEDVGKKLVSRIGYSPLSAFAFALLLAVLVLGTTALGFCRMDWVFPMTDGSSRSIGAACLPPKGSIDTQEGALRWGVIGKDKNGIAECSFSLLPVRPPDVGERMWCHSTSE